MTTGIPVEGLEGLSELQTIGIGTRRGFLLLLLQTGVSSMGPRLGVPIGLPACLPTSLLPNSGTYRDYVVEE
jgi:hypothetical protein